MPEQTNVERLLAGRAIQNVDDLDAEHQRILNEDFTKEEIDAIIKLGRELVGVTFSSNPDATGGAML